MRRWCGFTRKSCFGELTEEDGVQKQKKVETPISIEFVHAVLIPEARPCHISDHIAHTTPHINYTRLSPLLDKVLTTSNIGDYLNNSRPGAQQWTFMHSNEDPEKLPAWMLGWQNIPTPVGAEEVNVGDYYPGRFADVPEPPEADEEHIGLPEVQQQTARTAEQRSFSSLSSAEGVLSTPGRSNAPVILIVVPKADGVVDAFWFFFYSFNEGTSVMNIRFGNHVGDWEHTLIRFKHGKPQAAFLSAHSNGEAYSYDALEKRGKRVRLLPPYVHI